MKEEQVKKRKTGSGGSQRGIVTVRKLAGKHKSVCLLEVERAHVPNSV
jgi:hypothetical protein